MIFSRRRGEVVEIVIDNPPVNAIGSFLRISLSAGIGLAQEDETVAAVIITGGGRIFSAGADISEFQGGELPAEDAPGVIDEIEASHKPVVAAISGLCLGGGLELALACHHRVAVPAASFAFPEVKLGLLPGAGGTQRLPRLIGAAPALDMIVNGDPIDAETALASGLIDALCTADELIDRAAELARDAADKEPRRTGDRSAAVDDGFFERFAIAHGPKLAGLDAPQACVEAVRTATRTPLREGLAIETALFNRLLRSEQSQALRHVFFAERAAAKLPARPRGESARPIELVGIAGDGPAAASIAAVLLSRGMPVILFGGADRDSGRGIAAVHRHLEEGVAQGLYPAAKAAQALSRLTSTHDDRQLASCDLVIEAAGGDRQARREAMRLIDRIACEGAVLAAASSGGYLDDLASHTARPHDVVGLAFAPPRRDGGLVEIARGPATSPAAIGSAVVLARRLGTMCVITADGADGIGERLRAVYHGHVGAILRDGVAPASVGRMRVQFGMPGLDDEASALDRPGSARTVVSDDELRARLLFTTINEAAAILEEGVAQRASDIDVVQVHGHGWLRHKGGPMFWADRVGASTVVEGLERYWGALGPGFRISRYLMRKAEAGTSLPGHAMRRVSK